MKKTPIKRKKRTASGFNRIYGSRARVKWVASRPCIECLGGPCHNAHVVTGGKGRKADSAWIVPLCAKCHRAYDEHLPPFNDVLSRQMATAYAFQIERLWLARTAEGAA